MYAAAGGTGLGVLQAAADEGKLSIGVDSNQNHLHPGSVLTSTMKRVDVAVHTPSKSATAKAPGRGAPETLGLARSGVDYALDDNNNGHVLTPRDRRPSSTRRSRRSSTASWSSSPTSSDQSAVVAPLPGGCPRR